MSFEIRLGFHEKSTGGGHVPGEITLGCPRGRHTIWCGLESAKLRDLKSKYCFCAHVHEIMKYSCQHCVIFGSKFRSLRHCTLQLYSCSIQGHPRVISPVACPPPVDFAGNPSRNSKLAWAQLPKFYVFTTKSQSRCVKNW